MIIKNRFLTTITAKFFMSERKTIMIDDDVAKKIRNIQAKKIKETSSTVSFSSVINEMLRECSQESHKSK